MLGVVVFGKPNLVSIFLILIVFSPKLAHACLKVCKDSEKFFKSDLIELREYECDTNGECFVTVGFAKAFNGQAFSYAQFVHREEGILKLVIPLKVDDSGETNQTSLSAHTDHLENSQIHISYEQVDGCAYNSIIELKSDKFKKDY